MTAFKKGDVILIPFPFTDLSAAKQRPALIVSSNHFNQRCNDVIVIAISSQIHLNVLEDEYRLSIIDQKASGLPKSSIVKLGKVVTINQNLIRKLMCNLTKQTVALILNQFMNILDINQS